VDVNGEHEAEDLDRTGADSERVERFALGVEWRDRDEPGHEIAACNGREQNSQRRHGTSIVGPKGERRDGGREKDCHRDEARSQRRPFAQMLGSDRSVHACADSSGADQAEDFDAGEPGHGVLGVWTGAVSYRGKQSVSLRHQFEATTSRKEGDLMSSALRGTQTASATLPHRLGRERSRAAWGDPGYQAFMLLRLGLTVAPIAFGLDKFWNQMVYWPKYLAPWIDNIAPGSGQEFMYFVGAVEILAGIVVLVKPRYGAYLVAAWLAGIVVNLFSYPGWYDVAVRDFGLMLAALTLVRLASVYDPPLKRTR
jgi:hypothetical protein